MHKETLRSMIMSANDKLFLFFEWFHGECEDAGFPKVDRHHILTRLGIDYEVYEDWLEEGEID